MSVIQKIPNWKIAINCSVGFSFCVVVGIGLGLMLTLAANVQWPFWLLLAFGILAGLWFALTIYFSAQQNKDLLYQFEKQFGSRRW